MGHGAFDVGGEAQAPGGHVVRDDAVQPGLVDRDAAAFEHGDLRGIDVEAHDVVAHLGQAGAGNQADVAGADHGDLHADVLMAVRAVPAP